MLPFAIPLILGGLLQLVFGVPVLAHKGELRTTQARQLVSVLGVQGTVALLVILGAILIGLGLLVLSRAHGPDPLAHSWRED